MCLLQLLRLNEKNKVFTDKYKGLIIAFYKHLSITTSAIYPEKFRELVGKTRL